MRRAGAADGGGVLSARLRRRLARERCAGEGGLTGGADSLKLFLLGRRGSINHWLEDAAAAFRGDGHDVALGIVRHPALHQRLQRALVRPMAAEIAARVKRFEPDLILAIGGYHVPVDVLDVLRALPGRPPMVGWVGDAFGPEAQGMSAAYDLVAHTDRGLEARHHALGFETPTLWLPHAANPHRPGPSRERSDRMVFIGAASSERRRILAAVEQPMAIYGPGWSVDQPKQHGVTGRRVPHRALAALYASHLASLNIRNGANVLTGLNQRNFDPYLFGAAVVSDDQPDLARCFDVGREVLVYRSPAELNTFYARMKREPEWTGGLAARGRRRLMAEHTFAHRLAAIISA